MSRVKTEVAGKFHFYYWSTNGPGVKQASVDNFVKRKSPEDYMLWARSIQEELQGVRPWAPHILTASRF